MRQSGLVDLQRQEVARGVLLGGMADGFAQSGTDFDDERCFTVESGVRVEDEVRMHGRVGFVPGDVDHVLFRIVVPGLLPASLQPVAAADKADRAGQEWLRCMRGFGVAVGVARAAGRRCVGRTGLVSHLLQNSRGRDVAVGLVNLTYLERALVYVPCVDERFHISPAVPSLLQKS